MMQQVTFYGSSDDLVEVEGSLPGCDEYYLTDAEEHEFALTWAEGIGTMRGNIVLARYGDTGLWLFGVGPYDEGMPFVVESADITLHENKYSTELILMVPDATRVTLL
jgi:hypothetical protein